MEIKRFRIEDIEKFTKNRQIIALTGLRQVGKTTILKYFKSKFENSKYISFDDIKILSLFENDIDKFIEEFKTFDYLFIDEIQYSKNSGQKLKYIYDKLNIKIFISGSSKSEIAINSLKYLVGRVIIFLILPINFKEYILFKKNESLEKITEFKYLNLKNDFEKYLTYGGYPDIVLEKDKTKKKEILNSITNTYLLKEIKEILQIKNIFEYELILNHLALNDGAILNKSNLSSDTKINRNKVDEIVQILEKTGIITILRPFLKNRTKELIKSPKVYFTDLGFKNSLIQNFNGLNLRKDKGEIYENFILNSILNYDLKPFFFNLENKYEVDFVIEKNGEIYGFEVKSKLKNDNITNSIRKFCDFFNPKKIYIFNEEITKKITYNKTQIIFTNYLNIFEISQNLSKI